ncbi:family methyltransferase [Cordyceps militaris]|uniref:Family methyltransferase n=1 Tax=Cordyceps militaris TaxID=73501 RepID=A0A2H4SJ31_CORMI|nr:family methyltransferase [Cordyceps militaris]
MAAKSNAVPTAAVLIVALFLLITFWRNNLDGQQHASSSAAPLRSGAGQEEPATVTVTVTAPAADATGGALLTQNTPAEQVPMTPKAAMAKESRPRYIFVDLGANSADSLETFLETPAAKFKYDFPSPPWATHDEAEIFLFEANPVFNDALVHARQKYAALGKPITIYPSTVVDTTDGLRTFYLDEVNADHAYWGSSTYKNHPDAVASGGRGTDLSAVNIARWLLMNTLPHDFVVVKMDIEGAEYDIVPHLVSMRAWTVLDVLLVEWHDHLPTDEARQAAKNAIEKLQAQGVSCPHYDSST